MSLPGVVAVLAPVLLGALMAYWLKGARERAEASIESEVARLPDDVRRERLRDRLRTELGLCGGNPLRLWRFRKSIHDRVTEEFLAFVSPVDHLRWLEPNAPLPPVPRREQAAASALVASPILVSIAVVVSGPAELARVCWESPWLVGTFTLALALPVIAHRVSRSLRSTIAASCLACPMVAIVLLTGVGAAPSAEAGAVGTTTLGALLFAARHPMPIRRVRAPWARRLVFTCIAVLAASPAAAWSVAFSARFPTEAALQCATPDQRHFFIVDPGVCRSIERTTLADAPQVREYYEERGFDANFLLWAPTRRVDPGDADWAYCADPSRPGLCSPEDIRYRPVRDDIGAGRITVIQWGSSFISVACGNFSRETMRGPIPTLEGALYNDADGDARLDPGEGRLPGRSVQLVYNGKIVDSVTTGRDGEYSFALNATSLRIGPGRFTVRTPTPRGWRSTQVPAPVEVPYGAGNRTYPHLDIGLSPERPHEAVQRSLDGSTHKRRADAADVRRREIRATLLEWLVEMT